MSRDQLHRLLDRATDGTPAVDLAETAWAQAHRRQHRTVALGLGGAGMAAATVVTAVALGGGLGPSPTPAPADPDSVAQVDPVGEPVLIALSADGAAPIPSGAAVAATPEDVAGRAWQVSPLVAWSSQIGDPRLVQSTTPVTLTFDADRFVVRAPCVQMSAAGEVAAGGRIVTTGEWDVHPDPDPGADCVRDPAEDVAAWQRFFAQQPLLSLDGETLLVSGFTGAPDRPELIPVSVHLLRDDTGPAGLSGMAAYLGDWADDDDAVGPTGSTPMLLGRGLYLRIDRLGPGLKVGLRGACEDDGLSATWLREDGLLLGGGLASSEGASCWPPLTGADAQAFSATAELLHPLLGSGPWLDLDGDRLTITGWLQEDLVPGDEPPAGVSTDGVVIDIPADATWDASLLWDALMFLDGFSTVGVDHSDESVIVYWKGELPTAAVEVIDRARTDDLVVRVEEVPYSQTDTDWAASVVTARAIALGLDSFSVGATADRLGLSVGMPSDSELATLSPAELTEVLDSPVPIHEVMLYPPLPDDYVHPGWGLFPEPVPDDADDE